MQLSAQDYAEVLATLQAFDADRSDKRRFARMQVRGRIVVTPVTGGQVGTSYTALTRDMSFQGAGIMQTLPMQLGQTLLLYLPRRNRSVLCILSKAVHVRPLADGLIAVGCEFIAPAEPAVSKPPEAADAVHDAFKIKPPTEPPAAGGEAHPNAPTEPAAPPAPAPSAPAPPAPAPSAPTASPAPVAKPTPARAGAAPPGASPAVTR
jgi:hypothetical protein